MQIFTWQKIFFVIHNCKFEWASIWKAEICCDFLIKPRSLLTCMRTMLSWEMCPFPVGLQVVHLGPCNLINLFYCSLEGKNMKTRLIDLTLSSPICNKMQDVEIKLTGRTEKCLWQGHQDRVDGAEILIPPSKGNDDENEFFSIKHPQFLSSYYTVISVIMVDSQKSSLEVENVSYLCLTLAESNANFRANKAISLLLVFGFSVRCF